MKDELADRLIALLDLPTAVLELSGRVASLETPFVSCIGWMANGLLDVAGAASAADDDSAESAETIISPCLGGFER